MSAVDVSADDADGWMPAAIRRLGDLKAKHQQLAMDPRCSPPWVFLAYPSDEIAQLATDLSQQGVAASSRVDPRSP